MRDCVELLPRAGFPPLAHDGGSGEGKGEVKRTQFSEAIAQSAAIEQLAGNPLLLVYRWTMELAVASDPEPELARLDDTHKQNLWQRLAWTLQSAPEGLARQIIGAATQGTHPPAGFRGEWAPCLWCAAPRWSVSMHRLCVINSRLNKRSLLEQLKGEIVMA